MAKLGILLLVLLATRANAYPGSRSSEESGIEITASRDLPEMSLEDIKEVLERIERGEFEQPSDEVPVLMEASEREVDLDQAGREMTKREVCDGGKVCTSSVCTSGWGQKNLELICPSGKSPQVIKARYGYWSGSYANAALGKYKCKFIPEETSCTVDVKFNTNVCAGQNTCTLIAEKSKGYTACVGAWGLDKHDYMDVKFTCE